MLVSIVERIQERLKDGTDTIFNDQTRHILDVVLEITTICILHNKVYSAILVDMIVDEMDNIGVIHTRQSISLLCETLACEIIDNITIDNLNSNLLLLNMFMFT